MRINHHPTEQTPPPRRESSHWMSCHNNSQQNSAEIVGRHHLATSRANRTQQVKEATRMSQPCHNRRPMNLTELVQHDEQQKYLKRSLHYGTMDNGKHYRNDDEAIDRIRSGMKRRRRPSRSPPSLHPRKILLFVIYALACTDVVHKSEAFGLRHWRRIRAWSSSSSSSSSSATPPFAASNLKEDKESGPSSSSDSWSNAAMKGRSGSRLQVRKRVRAVLEKARTRTGIKNNSSSASGSNTIQTEQLRAGPSVVAEAASIGGLGVDGPADLVVQVSSSRLISMNGRQATTILNGLSNPQSAEAAAADFVSIPSNITDEELSLQSITEMPASNGVASSSTATVSATVPQESKSPTLTTASTTTPTSPTIPARKPKDFDVIRGDVPAATRFVEPLPFELPKLSANQKTQLLQGERVEEQSRMGREGSGYVVLDVKAPPFVVWECLLDFESYPELIPTVRSMQLYTSEKLNIGFVNERPVLPGTGRETRNYGKPSVTRASFVLSKFRLNIAAIHRYTPHPEGDYMEFTLDRSCTNMVLKGAKGIWYTQENPDGREGYTRVYLLASLQISRALPTFIVDYAAVRAMPRATTWLKPEVEALAQDWLEES